MKSAILSAASLAVAAAVATPAGAVEIRISSWAPPTHHINANVFPTWGKCIQNGTKGSVTYKIEYGLAPPPAQFNVVRKGIADATWIFHGYNAGRYVGTKVVEIPGLGTGAEAASVAYWRTYVKYLAPLNEHRGVKLVALMSHGPADLQTRRPITSLSQLKGMKIRLPGGVGSSVFEALGAVSVKVPAPKVYEVLSTGVADGATMPIEVQKSLKLAEVAQNILIMPGGFYYGSFAIIMNPKKYASLSKSQQAAVDKCSYEHLSMVAGKSWDSADVAGRKTAIAAGNKITTATPAMQKVFAPIAKKVTQAWFAEAKKRGLKDPQAALAYLRAQARAYKK
jgi:TRAP-type C4-dicarboxylate transport system substrate-binding protein